MTGERLHRLVQRLVFQNSGAYWERRYRRGGTSGAGSYGEQAEYKASYLNAFVERHDVASVVELGCGDGNQLTLASYPRYLGLDVSPSAVERCMKLFVDDETKSFFAYQPDRFSDPAGFLRADLALSLDVVYHLVEDPIFNGYMNNLFRLAERFVVIYANDSTSERTAPHVRRRRFSGWVEENAPAWSLLEKAESPADSFQDFFVFAFEGAAKHVAREVRE